MVRVLDEAQRSTVLSELAAKRTQASELFGSG